MDRPRLDPGISSQDFGKLINTPDGDGFVIATSLQGTQLTVAEDKLDVQFAGLDCFLQDSLQDWGGSYGSVHQEVHVR